MCPNNWSPEHPPRGDCGSSALLYTSATSCFHYLERTYLITKAWWHLSVVR